MSWATLAVAIAGLVLAVFSLWWQHITFELTGSKVKARLWVGVLTRSLGGQAVFRTTPDADWPEKITRVQREHGGERVLMLIASNVGRLAIGMDSVEAVFENGMRFSRADWHVNPSTGSTLEAGHKASWYVDLDSIQKMLDGAAAVRAEDNRPMRIWMELSLGTDEKPVRTPESIALTPGKLSRNPT